MAILSFLVKRTDDTDVIVTLFISVYEHNYQKVLLMSPFFEIRKPLFRDIIDLYVYGRTPIAVG